MENLQTALTLVIELLNERIKENPDGVLSYQEAKAISEVIVKSLYSDNLPENLFENKE